MVVVGAVVMVVVVVVVVMLVLVVVPTVVVLVLVLVLVLLMVTVVVIWCAWFWSGTVFDAAILASPAPFLSERPVQVNQSLKGKTAELRGELEGEQERARPVREEADALRNKVHPLAC